MSLASGAALTRAHPRRRLDLLQADANGSRPTGSPKEMKMKLKLTRDEIFLAIVSVGIGIGTSVMLAVAMAGAL